MRQNDVTSSNAMTDVISQLQLTSASTRIPRAFKIVTLLFDITGYKRGELELSEMVLR